MITTATKFRRAIGNDAHAPVSLVIDTGELRDHGAGMFLIGQAKPHRNRSEHARFVNWFAVRAESKGVTLLAGEPKCVIQLFDLLFKILGKFNGFRVLTCQPRKIGKSAQGLNPQPAVVELSFHWQQRSTLHPPVTDAEVLRESLWIVRGAEKVVSLRNAAPFFFCETDVAALGCVVVHGDDVERSGVRRSIAVRKILEPRNERRGLRDFVRYLSVFALIFADELERRARGSEIARGVKRERSPQRIAPEEPSETWTLAFARSAVASHQARAEERTVHDSLQHADARPVVGLLDLRVRQFHAERFAQIFAVVFRGRSQQFRVTACQFLVSRFGLRTAIQRARYRNQFCVSTFVGDAKAKRIHWRFGVVGLVFAPVFRCGGRADEGGELLGFLAKKKCALVFVPRRISAAERSWPFELKITQVLSFDLQREFSFDFERDNCTGLVYGNKERLAYRKSIRGVENGAGFGQSDQLAGQGLRGQNTYLGVKLQAKVAQEL